jgi:uncharacterized OsmC-like protein
LEEAAGAHDPDAVGEAEGFGEVVGDEDGGLAQGLFEVQELAVQLEAGEGVEGAERLVEKDEGRIGSEGAGEGDALALAAGELGGITAGVDGEIEAHERQHFAGSGLAALAVPAQEAGDELDVLIDPPVRNEAAVLGHVANSPAQGDGVQPGHGLTLDAHVAGRGFDQAVEGAQQRRLAAAALAHQGHRFARVDGQAHPAQRDGPTHVRLGDADGFEDGLGWHAGKSTLECYASGIMENDNEISAGIPVDPIDPVGAPGLSDTVKDGEVTVTGGPQGFAQQIVAGQHHFNVDEPTDVGGTGTGPTPYDLLLAGLGACTSMTMRLYADRKKIPLEGVRVRLRHGKVHAADCASCEEKPGKIDRIEREIELHGPLTVEQRLRLMEIADRCPVHRTLSSGIEIVSRLV